MLNTNNNVSFNGKIRINRFKNASNYQTTTIYTSLTDDRLIKLTANSIIKEGQSFKPVEDILAAPFARLIEIITGKKIKIGEQKKYMTNSSDQIVFQDKIPRIEGESVIIDFDKRLDI